MEEKSDENLEDWRKIEIIGINQTIVLEEALVNLMNQHVMKIFIDHDYTISQSMDYGSNTFLAS